MTLTTNGVLLEEQIADLAEAGLDDINISLDTLNAAEFAKVTRRESLIGCCMESRRHYSIRRLD